MTAARFLPQAEAELLHEVRYYSRGRDGAGIRFLASVEAAIDRAMRHPMGGAPGPAGTRAVLVRGFPFSVVYRVDTGVLLVIAIAAHRRRPRYWSPRVP